MLTLTLLSLLVCSFAKNIPANFGRVCGFGDFNNDRNTDIVVQQFGNLTILLQDDKLLNVLEEGVFKNSSTFSVGHDTVECSLGDFDGDSKMDILVSTKKRDGYHHSVWFARATSGDDLYTEKKLEVMAGQAMAVDVDGDGQHDVIGFLPDGSMYCQTFDRRSAFSKNCSDQFINFTPMKPYFGMPHLYLDIVGDDLLSELVFMAYANDSTSLQMHIWQRFKHGWLKSKLQLAPLLDHKYVGAPVAADFDADGLLELMVPICQDEDCTKVTSLLMCQAKSGCKSGLIDMADFSIQPEKDTKVIFRVGDYTLDGYPDLVVTVVDNKNAVSAKIVDNFPCTNCEHNGTRRFQLRSIMLIQPKEVALSTIIMSSFFDLKEDGNLDLLVEYNFGGQTKFSFIPSDEKGDTTFLKVQVFTSVCDKRCNPASTELGSGISWGGTCMTFSMSDGWGGSLQSAACQLPAVTHRSLMTPYVLFGLGRSPNFVDELVVGIPRYDDRVTGPARQHTLKQIVPNSRLIMMPPDLGSTHWQNRLYVTPSQLILQSLLVITSVCAMLMMVVAVLHCREKKEDRVERQQQSHRFHFDAM